MVVTSKSILFGVYIYRLKNLSGGLRKSILKKGIYLELSAFSAVDIQK